MTTGLNLADTMEELGVSAATVRRWADSMRYPLTALKAGNGRVLYSIASIEATRAHLEKTPTTEPASETDSTTDNEEIAS